MRSILLESVSTTDLLLHMEIVRSLVFMAADAHASKPRNVNLCEHELAGHGVCLDRATISVGMDAESSQVTSHVYPLPILGDVLGSDIIGD
jgi:hypothetical protein